MQFEDIVGQEEVKRVLLSEADEGRLPHALLLTGPEGCGKMPMALALAQYLCCTEKGGSHDTSSLFATPSTTDNGQTACGTCMSCKQWAQLTHPDVHFIFPMVANKARKKEICDDWISTWREMLLSNPYFTYADWQQRMEVDNSQPVIYARESDVIQKKLSLKSVQGGWRIVIIWLPEKMIEAGANKMLKLLEEPPVQTLFLLVSEEPQKILGTILSRVQHISMSRLQDEDIAQAIHERMNIDLNKCLVIAHMANGNYAKALQMITVGEGTSAMFQQFTTLMRLAWSRKVKDMKVWSEELADMGRESQKDFLLYAQRMIRESFMANFHRPEMNYMTTEEQQFTQKFAPFVSEKNAMDIMSELQEAQLHIEQNVNAKMVFFDLILQLTVLIKNH
ncbi:MAG: DNA polymerase III subunit [Bacteroidaceae bacterium]|nr:DNA polymerase III subunit [Bacteroidaceae bacterium]